MCRLLAVTVPENHQDKLNKEIMAPSLDALASTALRLLANDGAKGNRDGTGVAQIRDNELHLHKNSHAASVMTIADEYRAWMSDVDWTRPLLGHVRAASVGKKAVDKAGLLPDRHAQPFLGKYCILMHNGTIKNWRRVAADNEVADYSNWTDSWLVTQLLDQEEWTYELWKEVVEQLDGSYAFIGVHHKDEQKLWITRYKRPLYLYEIDDGAMNIICTSRELDVALMEVGETVYKLTGVDPWSKWDSIKLDEDEMYTLSIKDAGKLESLGKIEGYVWKEYSGQQQPADFKGFNVADVFYELFKEYRFTSSEVRAIWEANENVLPNCKWTPEAAQTVTRFIRWCVKDEDRIQVLANEIGTPIFKKEAA